LPEPAAALGVPAGIPVVMGAPDIHTAAIGSGAARDYDANLYVGTSSWLTCHVPYKKTDLFHNMASLPAALPGRYLLINEQEVAGGCLHFLRDNLLYPGDGLGPETPPQDFYRRLNDLAAATPPGSNGVLFFPWLNGERTPVDERALRGAFYNLGLETTRADMVRAVYEGVALNARWLLYYVERFIKRPLSAVNIAGGGAQSAVWRQIFADVLNRPIRQVADPLQVNTRGAGLLAALALGRLTVAQIGDVVPIQATSIPNPAHRELYDDYFDRFRRFYADNRKAFGRMNG
jgi:xylulokinase